MGFVAAKCTQCGANIEVDESKEAGICSHCGTPFITEKAINNYNITNNVTNNVVNNIANAVFKTGDDEDDFYQRYVALREMKNFYNTKKLIEEMVEKFPHKAVTHLCKADFHASVHDWDRQFAKFGEMRVDCANFESKSNDDLARNYKKNLCAYKFIAKPVDEYYLGKADEELSIARKMMTAEDKAKYADFEQSIVDKIELSRRLTKNIETAKDISSEFYRKKKRKKALGIAIAVVAVAVAVAVCILINVLK